jgi:hypothetical protein
VNVIPVSGLLPCALCGGFNRQLEEQDIKEYGVRRYSVYCTRYDCGSTTALCSSPDIAIKYWNRRESPKRAEEAYSKLVSALLACVNGDDKAFGNAEILLRELKELD